VGSNDNAEGGAIYARQDLNITSCTFCGCSSFNNGGGSISFHGTTLTILHTVFLYCSSYGLSLFTGIETEDGRVGGGVRLSDAGGYFKNCSFVNCVSSVDGGAIGVYNESSVDEKLLELDGCVFVSNVADQRGGAVDVRFIALNCEKCSFLHNKAGVSGSSIAGYLMYSVFLNTNVFVRNLVVKFRNTNYGGGTVLFMLSSYEFSLDLIKLIFFQSVVLDLGEDLRSLG
jgi:hypothetical protein